MGKTQVVLFSSDKEELPTNLREFSTWINTLLMDCVPPEYRDVAEIEIDTRGGYDDGYEIVVEVFYWRPETHEEERARKTEYRERQEKAVRFLEAQLAEKKALLSIESDP